MRFAVITHVEHKIVSGKIYAYAPYVREMNLWFKHVDEVDIVAPTSQGTPSDIEIAYQHDQIHFETIPSITFTSIKTSVLSVFKLPSILSAIFTMCQKADHIHLRCPGNIGLLGCLVQILFPKKTKTAKYAGNWDPRAKQPFTYKLQKWILSNSVLTKNMQVLVYGTWENQSKNIKPFFTASYSNSERERYQEKQYNYKLYFIFTGGIVKGKRPLLAIQIIETLNKKGYQATLDMYGEGELLSELTSYISDNQLQHVVSLKGNCSKAVIKNALKSAHFLMLPSKSEGWPKAVAEAMFFGVIPIATNISCVPNMLDFGQRGILIEPNRSQAVKEIIAHLNEEERLKQMSKAALNWSQNYTLDVFEKEISKLLISG
ncbi:glycosyltransferase family 4 protein [Changchengzhania lutea]|uniref:glycosyltransferase family 4 protein n=1 Tax=Changchengzhania lutea TaxID=2049305 RepID=UPI00115DF556|nr:glycosyltransferase [Changchengzhania lutea]